MNSETMQEFCGEEIQPGKSFDTDKDILNFIKEKEKLFIIHQELAKWDLTKRLWLTKI